jgi:predicted membrane channel-forming protein YqfA (hemolysin III family)
MRPLISELAHRAREEHDDLARETLGEAIASAVAHAVGAGLVIAAPVLGVVHAARVGRTWAVVAAAIYGATLI